MSLTQDFYGLAAELIGNTFAEFASPTVITKTTSFDYNTQQPTITTQTFSTIRIEYDVKQFDGQQIKIGDYMLIGERQKLTETPSPDNCAVTRKGEVCNLLRVSMDPADASITLHVRPQ